MKILAGLAFSVSVVFAGGSATHPEPFFKEGNVIHFATSAEGTKEGGKNMEQFLRIVSVKSEGTRSLATASLVYSSGGGKYGPYLQRFAFDSVNFYVHAANWMLEKEDNTITTFRYEGDSLIYPLNMKVGDTLADAWATETRSGKTFAYEDRLTFTNRKVVSHDTLDAPFGKIVAFRIEMIVAHQSKSTSDYNGRRRKKEIMRATEWYADGLGIIRSEYSDKYKGASLIVMKSYQN